MKIAPISGDLLVKAAAVLAVLALGYVLVKKATGAVGSVIDYGENAVNAVNPMNNNNVIYQAANTITGGSNADSSLGTRIYDFLNG